MIEMALLAVSLNEVSVLTRFHSPQQELTRPSKQIDQSKGRAGFLIRKAADTPVR